MKCKYCNGTGEHINDANRMTTCEFCGGTGEVNDKCSSTEFCEMKMGDVCTLGSPCPHQRPLTNEEYIRWCSTEELVHFLIRLCSCGWLTKDKLDVFLNSTYFPVYNMEEIANLEEWLKEKHNESNT